MAFGLSGFSARGVDLAGPNLKRGIQQVVLSITGTASDVDLDIGDSTGTFWSVVDNTDMGVKCLESLTRIAAQSTFMSWQCPQFVDKVQSAAGGSAGEYGVSLGTLGPNFAIHTGEGDTTYYVILTYELNNRIFPEINLYGVL